MPDFDNLKKMFPIVSGLLVCQTNWKNGGRFWSADSLFLKDWLFVESDLVEFFFGGFLNTEFEFIDIE